MGTLRIGSVIKVSEWCLVDRGHHLCYGLVVSIDEGNEYRGGYRRKMKVAWGLTPRNPNLRSPRVIWFENTEKWDRCEVVRW